jgi:DNA topoisomerase-1
MSPKSLGIDPETGLPVYLVIGSFRPHVRLGVVGEDGKRVRRASIPKHFDPRQITLKLALDLLRLPRDLGNHPDTGKPVKAGVGRFGPYIVHEDVFKSLPKNLDVLKIDLAAAVKLLK